jgi:MATE family multidrug resistance protein
VQFFPVDKLSYKVLVRRAWPIILANISVPVLGLVDTGIIGNVGDTHALGAIALGGLIYSFLYWSFGFLRMSTTGFVAQAAGAGQEGEIRLVVLRALLLAAGLGFALFVSQWLVADLAFSLFGASAAVEGAAREYFLLRIWSAPATLVTFVLFGTLIGLGNSRMLLVMQLFLNGTNAVLDLWFAGVLGWGVRGIALGTVVAEWSTALLGGLVLLRIFRARGMGMLTGPALADIVERSALLRLFNVNRDIFIRTLALVFGFAWFNNESARLGDAVLAGNHLLLQFIAFSAFFLDGYAMVAESVVGNAPGSRRLADFDLAVRRTTVLAVMTAAVLAGLLCLHGEVFIALLTDIPEVQTQAAVFLSMSAVYIGLSAFAFQLDGIFIGALLSREMRNAQLLSLAGFLLVWWWLTPSLGNQGLWLAFVLYVVLRAITLAWHFPALRRGIQGAGL